MKIYVGNLSYNTTDSDLASAFEQYGQVESASVVIDRMTNRSRGFGFVEMPDSNEAREAIAGMEGKDLQGRNLKVSEARPKDGASGGGGGYRGGGGGGGGNRGGGRRQY